MYILYILCLCFLISDTKGKNQLLVVTHFTNPQISMCNRKLQEFDGFEV